MLQNPHKMGLAYLLGYGIMVKWNRGRPPPSPLSQFGRGGARSEAKGGGEGHRLRNDTVQVEQDKGEMCNLKT
jgi:hypothetical protein